MAKTIVQTHITLPELVITANPGRAKAELLKPFILESEGGLSRSGIDRASANFCPTPNPEDGHKYHTNKGITYITWKNFFGPDRDLDFYKMSDEDWMHIFKKGYWDKWKADHLYSQEVANALVDWVWGSGIWGIKYPQRMIGVQDDGIVGDITLRAVNRQNKDNFLKRLYARREQHFRDIAKDPVQKGNLTGWLNRLENLKAYNDRFYKYR